MEKLTNAKIDFQNFNLSSIESITKGTDLFFETDSTIIFKKGDFFTVSNYGRIEMKKGSENLYLSIDIHLIHSKLEHTTVLQIWTKEAQEDLKSIAKEIINQIF